MSSTSSAISSYICVLLRILEQPEQDSTHYSNVHGLPPLSDLVKDTLSACQLHARPYHRFLCHQASSSSWTIPSIDNLYTIKLLRRCILTKFEVLCATTMRYAAAPSQLCQMCGEIVEAAAHFNTKVLPLLVQTQHNTSYKWRNSFEHTKLLFSDFVGVFVSRCSERIAKKLLLSCSEVDDILRLVQDEARFIKSVVSTFNAHSFLLNEQSVIDTETHLSEPSSSNDSTSHCREDSLKRIELSVNSELWKKVAVVVKYTTYSKRLELQQLKHLTRAASESLRSDVDFAVPSECMEYISTMITIEEQLMKWDKGFQDMLASSQKLTSNKKSCKPVDVLCTNVLPHIEDAIRSTKPAESQAINSAALLAKCLNQLTTSHHFIIPLTFITHAISNILLTSLHLSLASWNLPMLTHYTFSVAPRACYSVSNVQTMIHEVLPSATGMTAFSETNTRGYMIERRMRESYSTLQRTISYMSDGLESVCLYFHDFLCERCKHCLTSAFPSPKHWKAIKKQRNSTYDRSKYCDVIVEQLIVPMSEAALSLEGESQKAYMILAVSILFNEYRKLILQNKHTYRSFAGRQLLVDFHYLCEWITSDKLGLSPSTVQDLSSLSVILDIEQGLQFLCGGTQHERSLTDSSSRDIVGSDSDVLCVRGLSSLPVWSEIAWYSSTDWHTCIISS